MTFSNWRVALAAMVCWVSVGALVALSRADEPPIALYVAAISVGTAGVIALLWRAGGSSAPGVMSARSVLLVSAGAAGGRARRGAVWRISV